MEEEELEVEEMGYEKMKEKEKNNSKHRRMTCLF